MSCLQDISILLILQSSVTLMAVVRQIKYYNFIILLMCSKYILLNNKSLNPKTRLSCYGCYQCFTPIFLVVALLDNISSPPSRPVPTYLCTFCTQLFCYLNEDILISKILSNIRWLISYMSSYFRSKNKYCRDIVITVKPRKTLFFIWRLKWWNYHLF